MAIWLFIVIMCNVLVIVIIVPTIIRIKKFQKTIKELITIKKGMIESQRKKKKIINDLISEKHNYKKENRKLKTIIKELRLKLGEKNASNNFKKTKSI